MLPTKNAYDQEMLQMLGIEDLQVKEITEQLEKYLREYHSCFGNSSQEKYFDAFEKGLLSDLERKTIEPIALTLLGEKEVRGFQQFFQRATFSDDLLLKQYQSHLLSVLEAEDGFLSVDGSDFPKKGKQSVGVARQYCGRLGKVENCQAGVFLSYATEKGYGLVDRRLYLPEEWFSAEKAQLREKCKVPEDTVFQTKNEIALDMICQTLKNGKFPVKWIGCDAAFGSDHNFLMGLPESVCYFAAVKDSELVFRERPEMKFPEGKSGRPCKHLQPAFPPVTVKSIALNPDIPWEKRTLTMGAKGPVRAWVKCLPCVSCDDRTPQQDVWLYIRKYEGGTIKYFLSNAPADTPQSTLDRLATMRWSIEQCFQECKSYLGMTHYETRTYIGWHRHMLLVMIAHLFTTELRRCLQKNSV